MLVAQARVRASPSVSEVRARKPSSDSARDTSSAERRMSPSRAGSKVGVALDPGGRGAGLVQLEHRRLGPAADVEDPAALVRRRREQRLDDVADVDEVACLQPVAEDRPSARRGEPVEEDRDDAALEARRLARPEDVPEPGDDVARAVDAVEADEVLLGAELRDPVRRERPERAVLERGPVALAVDRAARRGEDDPRPRARAPPRRRATVPTTFTSASCAGPSHRCLDVGLRGEVKDDVDAVEVDARRGCRARRASPPG